MDEAIKIISDVIKKQAEAVSEASEALSMGDLPEQTAYALERVRMSNIEQMQTLILEMTRLYTADSGEDVTDE